MREEEYVYHTMPYAVLAYLLTVVSASEIQVRYRPASGEKAKQNQGYARHGTADAAGCLCPSVRRRRRPQLADVLIVPSGCGEPASGLML